MLQEPGVPLVLIGRTGDTSGLSYVDIDFDQTVRDAVAHLVGLGHRRIVYVNHSEPRRGSGYGPACAHPAGLPRGDGGHGLEPVMIPAEDTAAGGRRRARRRVRAGAGPDRRAGDERERDLRHPR